MEGELHLLARHIRHDGLAFPNRIGWGRLLTACHLLRLSSRFYLHPRPQPQRSDWVLQRQHRGGRRGPHDPLLHLVRRRLRAGGDRHTTHPGFCPPAFHTGGVHRHHHHLHQPHHWLQSGLHPVTLLRSNDNVT